MSKNRNLSTLAPANTDNFAVSTNASFTGTLNTADVNVSGNLVVTGTTVTVNVATLDVKDLNITVAKGATTNAAANGAGITVDPSNAQLFYTSSDDSWNSNKPFNVAVNTTTDAVRITQTGTGNALIVEDSANPDSTPFIIDNAGQVGIGGTPTTGRTLDIRKTITGSTASYAIAAVGTIQSDVTTASAYMISSSSTAASSFTLPILYNYIATQGTFGAGSTVTNQYGFAASSTMIGATNNFGFYGNIPDGTGRWNFFANGTAPNYFAGKVLIGSTSIPLAQYVLRAAGDLLIGNNVDETPDASWSGQLTINGNSYAGGIALDTSGMWVGHNSTTRSLIFATDETERMRITPTGNVAIGVTSAATYLQVGSRTAGDSPTIRISNDGTASGNASLSLFRNTSDYALIEHSPAGGYNTLTLKVNHVSSGFSFQTANGNSSFTERMRIDTAGNVGIGTSSPSTYGKLAVAVPTAGYGFLSINNSAGGGGGGQLSYYYGTAKVAYVDSAVTNGTAGSETAYLAFATSNSGTIAERARIDTIGRFLVGATSHYWDISNSYLQVGSAGGSITIHSGGVTGYGARLYTTNRGLEFDNNSAVRDYVFTKSSGGSFASVTASAFTIGSDYRLKRDITDISDALSVVQQIRPRHFRFKSIEETGINFGDNYVDGFVAHELQEIVPYAVMGEKDELFDDGAPKYQSVDLSKLVPLLTAAIKELKTELDSVKAELNTLKGA